MIVDDDVADGGLDYAAYDPYDPTVLADPVAAGVAAGPVTTVAGPLARRGAGGRWVTLLLLAAAGVAVFGLVSALAAGSAWGMILNGVAAVLCLVGALVERGVRGVGPIGTGAMRVGHYARLVLVVAVLAAVVRYGAEDEGGLDAVAWHVPTAIFAVAVVVQWWRDPQRMT